MVFTPQILENFRRRSADGLSLLFIIVWLLGDVFNILGAVLQGVLPTMIILAVYYTLADLVLLGQCLWYRKRGKNGSEDEIAVEDEDDEDDQRPLLEREGGSPRRHTPADADGRWSSRHGSRTGSSSSLQARLLGLDPTHLSPATPYAGSRRPSQALRSSEADPHATKRSSILSSVLSNASALALVTLAGVLGWYLSSRSHQYRDPSDKELLVDPLPDPISSFHHNPDHRHHHHQQRPPSDPLSFSPFGQFFGYLCAILYLFSRLPQLILNARRKSVEGLSTLFFLFACLGNITYVASIFAYEPPCASFVEIISAGAAECRSGEGEFRKQYARYILVNLSWIIGSTGTLVLDFAVLAQFWVYRGRKPTSPTSTSSSLPNVS